VASSPQPGNQLENRRSENNEMSGRMWKAVETSLGKIWIGKAKGVRSKGRNREEMREKGKEKVGERKNSRDQESGREVGDLG